MSGQEQQPQQGAIDNTDGSNKAEKRAQREAAKVEREAAKVEREARKANRKAHREQRCAQREARKVQRAQGDRTKKEHKDNPACTSGDSSDDNVQDTTTTSSSSSGEETVAAGTSTDQDRKVAREARKAQRDAKCEDRLARKAELTNMRASQLESIPADITAFYIDGNNISGGGPHRMRRDVLLELVETFIGRQQRGVDSAAILQTIAVTLLFDHHHSPMQSKLANLVVQFSGDTIADDVIVAQLAAAKQAAAEDETQTQTQKPKPKTMVITSDRELSCRILREDGCIMRSGHFARLLDPQGLHARGREGGRRHH
eukprot:TRINITY_DN1329_c0_g1_i5.p2 TRINITY_DN1329_c0_g1~~TRINITY_DN1329_c0_g1_i5.p2  ORF type:complete len:315 (+),score=89.35 TRINITY_DN1329_c0_g1_i5:1384-2328(+)